MEQDNKDVEIFLSEEDKAIAYRLAAALCRDDVEEFLQIYDNIPVSVASRTVGNIKEMARQVAALTRTSTYRHGPIANKDLGYFGNSHALQNTTQLTLSTPLCTNDFNAFKTPPEGRTPVDVKHFDYGDETTATTTLKIEPKTLIDLCNGYVVGLNNSTIPTVMDFGQPPDKNFDEDGVKNEDDAYHTPPEFQDESTACDKDITSVIEILSEYKSTSEQCESEELSKGAVGEQEGLISDGEDKSIDSEDKASNSEKDSFEGSPVGSRKFTQEEDDSGISTVDENDVSRDSRDSPTMPLKEENYKEKRKQENKLNKKTTAVNTYSPKSDKRHDFKHHSPRSDRKITSQVAKTNTKADTKVDTEDNSGWQTRYRRTSKKQKERELDRRYHNNYNNYGQNNAQEFKWSSRDRKYPDMNYASKGKSPEDSNKQLNHKRKNEELEHANEHAMNRQHSPNGYRDNVWVKNGSKGMFMNTDSKQTSGSDTPMNAPNTFSYRDALLKASNAKDLNQSPAMSYNKSRQEYDISSPANYLLSVWTFVKNLQKKDPTKVFVLSED